MDAPWVVKLGGSLACSAELPRWLEALIASGAVIVPGGGPFADVVRDAQGRWHFDDMTAHHMAMSGMAQYGRMLRGLNGRLRLQADWRKLDIEARVEGAVAWLPDPCSLDGESVDASWDVTSDSLSLWLAKRLGAHRLLLVKSVEPPSGEAAVEELAAAGLLDAAFPRMSRDAFCDIWLCGPGRHRNLSDCLRQPSLGFTRAIIN